MPSWPEMCKHFIVSRFYAYAVTAESATDFGPVRVAATDAGVVAVELLGSAEGFETELARRGIVVDAGAVGGKAREHLEAAVEVVTTILAGEAAETGTIPVDLGDRPEWDRLVLGAVRTIPRGTTWSYGEVARRIGKPGAARAVGGAVGRNPVGLLIPCHRVIAGDGSLGGYGAAAWGGIEAALDLKAALLALEGVTVRRVRGVSSG
jgi:methylated-DNA-[protein]-cysteine S-methyltransferase